MCKRVLRFAIPPALLIADFACSQKYPMLDAAPIASKMFERGMIP